MLVGAAAAHSACLVLAGGFRLITVRCLYPGGELGRVNASSTVFCQDPANMQTFPPASRLYNL
jgi:hypothetical protein